MTAVAASPWFVVASGVASIAAFLWFLYEKSSSTPELGSNVVLSVCIIVLSSGYVYSFRVRTENIALRDIAKVFLTINTIYRDKLHDLFASAHPVTKPQDLVGEEERVLRAVCERIGHGIFARVIGRPCMVTIKLVTQDNGRYYAQTYVRSQELCERDKGEPVKYWLGTNENTAFDEASKRRADRPSHYYSPDLRKESGYCNQRQHYDRHYRSVLVVPIRGVNTGREGTNDEFDLIGFLCVDTLSTNRLNNGFHLDMLSALASQMYNFISLMRGKYLVMVD